MKASTVGKLSMKVLQLRKERFDLVWALMIAFGIASLFLNSHPLHFAPWASAILLGVALAIGLSLTLFVKRDSARSDGESHSLISTQVQGLSLESCSIQPQAPEHFSSSHVTAEVRRSARGFRRLQDIRLQEISWAESAQIIVQAELRAEIENTTREVMELYVAEVRASRSRDLVKEAVEIARQLQGTSCEVRICRDGEIVIFDPKVQRLDNLELNFGARSTVRQSSSQLN